MVYNYGYNFPTLFFMLLLLLQFAQSQSTNCRNVPEYNEAVLAFFTNKVMNCMCLDTEVGVF